MLIQFRRSLTLAVLGSCGLVKADYYKLSGESDVRLKFNSNNRFKIVQLTDLSFGEDYDMTTETVALIDEIIKKEKPDFVAVTGDIVEGQQYD